MKKIVMSALAGAAIMMPGMITGTAWAQSSSATVSPKTVPLTTRGIKESASDAAREALQKEQQGGKEMGEEKSRKGRSMKDKKKPAK